MYTEILDVLGLSDKSAQYIAVLSVCIFVAGFIIVHLWRYILFGSIALFCISVLLTENSQVFADTKEIVESIQDDTKKFLEDCISYTDYSKQKCENIWFGRDSEN